MIERALNRVANVGFAPRDALGLAVLRVFVGLLGLVSALRFIHYGWVDEFFVAPRYFFTYSFAPFVAPLGANGMHAVFWIIAAAGALVALGLFYRPAIVTMFGAFTYVALIDVTNYLNHYYLLSLLTLLMSLMPLGRCYGLDRWIVERRTGAPRRKTLPAWCYLLLQLQVGVVYTYAGVAKLSEDWLIHAQPLSIWLAARTSLPVIGPWLAHPWSPHVMGWAGCLFDLTIVGWLLWRRTRAAAFVALVIFHALTRYLFPIGMFPFIMVASATVFFDPRWPRRLLRWSPLETSHEPRVRVPSRRLLALGTAAFFLYAGVQILVPLRALAYGGNVHWHEQGMRFSWRVMVREKNASVTYLVDDPRSGRTYEVNPRTYLDARQAREFGTQPDLVAALARHIAEEWEKKIGQPVRVRAEVLASLNGRCAALLVDPSVDLARVDSGLGSASWVLPAPPGKPPFLHASK